MGSTSFEIELTAMAHGGSALGRHQGRTVFVPYAIPGERALVRLRAEKGRVAYAEGVQLLAASNDRVFPRCPHFGPRGCGRCHWQHIAYPAQLLLKQDVLADQLDRIGGFDNADVQPVIASPLEWGYNHHMTFTCDGQTLGFPAADGRALTDIAECHILHPELLSLRQALDLDLTGLKQMKLQIGSDGARMVILSVTGDQAPELQADLLASVALLLEDNEPVSLIGESHSRYRVQGREFRVTAGAYFRANAAHMDTLVNTVLTALGLSGGETVLDLYAGVGLFSAFMAARVRRLTLVESYPPAVTDADANLADFDHVDVIEGSVEDVLDALDTGYDAALLDPPGDGLSLDALDGLAAADIPRLVYVSSDPATLARDGKRLAAQGYRLGTVQPLDLAPHTFYIDSVAVFERRG